MTGSPDRTTAEIKTVLLCSDMLATRESEQQSNLRWFADLFARPIREALPGAEVRVGPGPGFDRMALIGAAAGPGAAKARHCWFDAGAVDADALTAAIGAETLVVGYEMSTMTRAALTAAAVPWVDIWLHPVRFADDILFGVRASVPEMNARLQDFAIDDEALRAQADVLRVQNYRGGTRPEAKLVDGAALFVGQTARDKSVLVRDGFLGLPDFQEQFAAVAGSHPHVYFSRHPHQPHLAEEVRAFLGGFGNVSETQVPTYHLLADDRIASVASISSSVLEEARYFGKAVHRFHPPPFPLEGEERYAAVLHAPCFSHFWATLLRGHAAVAETRPAAFIDPRNKLRHALSFTWGYRDIDPYERDRAGPVAQGEVTVETAGVVSFDVFDTLITRRVASPRDVFALIAEEVAGIAGEDASGFVENRLAAEKEATRSVSERGREDPGLSDIYAALLKCGEDDPRVARLCALEIAAEMRMVRRRPAGAAMFERARQAGRRIVLVSDMYLPREAVEALLAACGYTGWEALLLSSEAGVTKRSGALFGRLLAETGADAGDVLHIGDNRRGDVAVPGAMGIATLHLPASLDRMREAAPFLRGAIAKMANDGDAATSSALAQVATRAYDDTGSELGGDGFGRDAERLGYVVLGPLLAGFADWLHRE
ncbi:MAG: hypothetical protein LJE62_05115, partial [Silicimonas sp.]|nr:hypothetical protein [Silicimonas sp.]